MSKCSINCPYCNKEIIVDFSKIITSKDTKKETTKIANVKTMNDYASVMQVKKIDDLVITSLSYFYFTKNIDKVSYGDLYKSMKNADKYFSKLKGNSKEAIGRLLQKKRIVEKENQIYSLDNKEIKRIGGAIKKYL